jgi:soluble lytic murein transglycosylase-like protein
VAKKELGMKNFFIVVSILFAFKAHSAEKISIIEMIRNQAQKNDVNVNLALAIADVESKFNPDAKKFESKFNTYSIGIFQIFIPTSRALGFSGYWQDLFRPKINIELGIKHLRICTERFKENIELIACCHNAGFAVKESVCKNNPNVKEYVSKVLTAYKMWEIKKIAYN